MSFPYKLDLQLFADEDLEQEQEVIEEQPDEQQEDNPQGKVYTEAEVEEILKKRIYPEKQKAAREVQAYQERLTRLAQLSGTTVEQLTAYLDNPQAYVQQQRQPVDAQVAMEARKAQEMAIGAYYAVEEAELKKDPRFSGYAEVAEEVKDYAKLNGLPLKKAYLLLHGEDLLKRIEQDTEQRVLASANKRKGLGAESDNAAEFKKLGITEEEAAFCRHSGMSIQEFAALKNASSIDAYRKLKQTKR